AGNRMSRPPAAGRSHGWPLRCLAPTAPVCARRAAQRLSSHVPEGDDMSTSAGVATAAHEGPAAAVRGEDAGAQAAIVIVCRDPGAREILHWELSRRYGAGYQILVCDRPAELAARVRDLRTAGLPVALVIGAVGAQDPDGIEMLAPVR